jgi:hypothetical protein
MKLMKHYGAGGISPNLVLIRYNNDVSSANA